MNRELFDPPGIVRPAEALAELAGRINAEHHQVETALRASLEHAKRAGELLLEAKEQCKHGEWMDWLKAHVHFTPRTVQRYMSIASRWNELANATRVSHLSYREALQVLAEPSTPDEAAEDEPKRQRVSHLDDVPPALAHYRDAGLLDEECIGLLMGLQADYGPEIAAPFKDEGELLNPDGITAEDAWDILNVLRPLGKPALWPIPGKAQVPVAVLRGVQLFLRDVNDRLVNGFGGREEIPQWEVTAF